MSRHFASKPVPEDRDDRADAARTELLKALDHLDEAFELAPDKSKIEAATRSWRRAIRLLLGETT